MVCKDNPDWLIYHELVFTSKEYMRTVCEIKPEWLIEIAPHYFTEDLLKEHAKNINKIRAQVDVNKF